MVVTKMASRFHACIVSSAGHGMMNRMNRPTATAAAAFFQSTGCTHSLCCDLCLFEAPADILASVHGREQGEAHSELGRHCWHVRCLRSSSLAGNIGAGWYGCLQDATHWIVHVFCKL